MEYWVTEKTDNFTPALTLPHQGGGKLFFSLSMGKEYELSFL